MKLALVIPWFGRELKGGAEQQAWQLATRLAARGHAVEVLTTCCRSHQDDWATNHLTAGLTNEPENFAIRRFPVEPRDRARFEIVAQHLQTLPREALRPGVSPVSTEESHIFVAELIKSPALLEYLARHATAYDRFIFLPYLYGPVIEGISIVAERAALLPCLHDEAYAYLSEVAESFRRAGLLLFNSAGEQELALRLFGPGIWRKCRLVGGGIETALGENLAPPQTEEASGRYILYLGRKEGGKNVPMLLRAFERFRRDWPDSDLRLLLAGHGTAAVNGLDQVCDLGLVAEEEKDALLRGCIALFQPSENESFSRVVMEAWMRGRPVAAHEDCLATAVAVRAARGGWTAGTEEEWARLFTDVDLMPSADLRSLGENGERYACDLADWEKVITRYEAALAVSSSARRRTIGGQTEAIHQVLPNLSFGDAISRFAIWIRDQVRELGYRSEIFAHYIDPRLAREGNAFSPEALRASDALIYHHSTSSEITPHIAQFQGPKCLVYHNITPPEFFEPFWPEHAALLRRARADLAALAAHFSISVGVSEYNARELRQCGFAEPGVLPISVDPAQWSIAPDRELMDELQDGRTNLLFVGRIAPNKKQDELVLAFAEYLRLDPEARLILVGKSEENDGYALYLRRMIEELRLTSQVFVTGSIDEAKLAAYWRSADLFWSMSEHEGFCVPLLEAMWFDVPIIAFHAAAVPETLGSAGLTFTRKDDPTASAALAYLVVSDAELRRKILEAQRQERVRFLPEKARPILDLLVAQLLPAENLSCGQG